LTEAERVNFSDNETFSVGNRDAKLSISLISNPYCGFCKDAHKILEDLLEKYPNDISAQMRFNYSPERADEKYNNLISDFTHIYKNRSQNDFLKAVDTWFQNKDESKIRTIAGTNSKLEDLAPLIQMTKENSEAGLNFTPIFIINGYQFPDKYDREDIWFFISELLEDEEF